MAWMSITKSLWTKAVRRCAVTFELNPHQQTALLTGQKTTQLNNREKQMTFEKWWETLTVAEQKLIGYNVARFVWEQALALGKK